MNKFFAIYMIVAIIAMEYSMRRQMKMKPRNKSEEERDKEFHAFNKTDAYLAEDPMSRLVLYPCALLLPFRLLGGWIGACWMCCMVTLFASIC